MSARSFMDGVVSILTLFPDRVDVAIHPPLADDDAYRSDMDAIANDMQCAVHIIAQENNILETPSTH